jgi:hypothetical protein
VTKELVGAVDEVNDHFRLMLDVVAASSRRGKEVRAYYCQFVTKVSSEPFPTRFTD